MDEPVTQPARPIVILGPTAGGKSEFAVSLALRLARPGEVVNADSMQVYRRMEAGTAKPPAHLRERVSHHLIDIAEPTERFTVADWLTRADALIAEIAGRGRTPIVVGGTNLYIRALLEGLFDGPSIDPELRDRLTQLSNRELHDRLGAVDPPSAQRIHVNDTRKLVRALEVYELTGKPISAQQQQWTEWGSAESRGQAPGSESAPQGYRHSPILIGLQWPAELINPRINARVKEMFFPATCGLASESLPDETARLENDHQLGPQAREALGYKQVLAHLHDEMTLDEAFEKTKILTRRFAKSQRTWLKRFRGVHWLPASTLTPDELARRASEIISS
ncbi:MAG: tRNA (adenosine(37)-N6)-dimethylallyltransferase MiaA [Planctomycetes bacterium]|nr:tRNA (adenosine(37)-N6)-dimethylallyltransferase MiaA [Planctomycetota bacterium]